MENVALWQLVADAGLVLGVIFLAVRLFRSGISAGHQAKVRSLEMQVRATLREAQSAAAEFERALDAKQKVLEEVLFEVQATESRVRRTIEQAKEVPHREQQSVEIIARSAHSIPAAIPASSQGKEKEEAQITAPVYSAAPVAAELPIETAESFEAKSPNPFLAAITRKTEGKGPRLNVFGEPIPGTEELASTEVLPSRNEQAHSTYASSGNARPSLASQIETFVDEPSRKAEPLPAAVPVSQASKRGVEQRPAVFSIEDIYAAAEEFLRAGQSLELVSARTRLPAEEVRMLSQIIASETGNRVETQPESFVQDFSEEEPIINRADERLGVLGGMRRNDRVL